MMWKARRSLLVFLVTTFIFATSYVIFDNEHRNLHDQIHDRLLPLLVESAAEESESLAFVFVDIDQETYLAWGEQPVTPRGELAQILETLEERARGARAIVLNIDTSYSLASCGVGQAGNGDGQCADEKLLRRWAASYRGAPPVILARSLDQRRTEGGRDYRAPQSSILDDIVRPGLIADMDLSGGLHWGAPSFLESGRDGVIRSWTLWQDVCQQGRPLIMPSVQLLTLLAISDRRPALTADVVGRLAANRPASCGQPRSALPDDWHLISPRDGITIDLGKGWRSQRIHYAIGDTPSSQPALVTRVPANKLDSLAPGDFDGRIVVIGATHPLARDLHETPLGSMSGSLVIINAIWSLHTYGTIAEPAVGQQLIWITALVAAFAAVLRFANPAIAPYAMSAVAGLLTVILFLRDPAGGHWLDIAFAGALFLFLHQSIQRLAEFCSWWRSGRRLSNTEAPTVGGDGTRITERR